MDGKTVVLFIAESATLAHVARPFKLASSLNPEKYDVHFSADNYFKFVFEGAPFKYHPIFSRSPADFDAILKEKGVLFDAPILEHYIKDELQLLAEVKPDIVVGDLRPSLAVSAPLMGVPYLSLSNGYWSPHGRTNQCPLPYSNILKTVRHSSILSKLILNLGTSLFQRMLPNILSEQGAGLNTVREKLGLEPFQNYLTGFTWGDTTLFCDPASLVPLSEVPKSHRFIGPVSWSPKIPLPTWWNEIPTGRPLIYVSLGSSGDLSLVDTLIEALGPISISVVVATAGRKLKSKLPKTFYVADYLPGDQLVKRADVVITNGGSPSSYQALEAGVPVLGLPVNMDQFLCMERIAAHGSGILIRSDMATPRKVRSALRALLSEKKYRHQAELIQRECSQSNSNINFLNILEEWIEIRKQEKITMLRR